jgi:integrase/recombinase XerC
VTQELVTRQPPLNVAMLTLTPFIQSYAAGRKDRGEVKAITAAQDHSKLGHFAVAHGQRPLSQLGAGTVDRWLRLIAANKPATQRVTWSTVGMFCDWLVLQGKIKANPLDGLKRPKVPRRVARPIDADRVGVLLAEVPDERAVLVVSLMVELGLRCAEVAGLSVEDWNRRDETLFVVGKGSNERLVPVTSAARRAIEDYLAVAPATSGPLVRNQLNGGRLKVRTIGVYVRGWLYDAGIKRRPYDGVNAHALRHTAASDVMDRCEDPRVVQQLLGHAHLATTEIYMRRAGLAKMRAAMEGRDYRRSA